MGGVSCLGKRGSIGLDTVLDSMFPDKIILHENVVIAMNCVILTHFIIPNKISYHHMEAGTVELDDNCFIGAGTIICNSCRIGKNSVVGAGSVVTKDIPDNEIWAGVPARFLKKREVVFA